MMKGKSTGLIKKRMKIFLTPQRTKTHGRPIYRDEARKCGLTIEAADGRSALWRNIYELYIRTYNFVSTQAVKTIETECDAFFASTRRQHE